ncbi:hypothetical protein [Psychrilyobacter sp.]
MQDLAEDYGITKYPFGHPYKTVKPVDCSKGYGSVSFVEGVCEAV